MSERNTTNILLEQSNINSSSEICNEILNLLVNECVKDLDAYICQISTNFNDILKINNVVLDNFILNIPMLIYYTHSKLEQLGLKHDLSAVERKRRVSDIIAKNEMNLKNKSEKQLEADLQTIDIAILEDIYDRAYKIVKSKIDTAYELLASCKKIMSRRIEELKVEHSDTCRQQNPRTLHS